MAALKGIKRRAAREQTAMLLRLVNLEQAAHKKIGTFSGGMRQRVLRNYIAEIARERIVLLATHVVSDIECVAQRVMLLNHGKLTAYDTPEALVASARGRIGVFSGSYEEIRALQAQYPKGELKQTGTGFSLRIAAQELPEHCTPAEDTGLEDVYRLLLEGCHA